MKKLKMIEKYTNSFNEPLEIIQLDDKKSDLITKKRKIKSQVTSIDDFVSIKKQKVSDQLEIETEMLVQSISSSILTREFYLKDVVQLSQDLLGKLIVRIVDGVEIIARIVETEAYKAPEDKACHAYNNKKNDRTKYFWQIGGCLYVYMIYNVNCLNITAATAEEPEAVLIRAVEPIKGIEKIKELRKYKPNEKITQSKFRDLTNGPGKVGAALSFDRSHNGIDLCNCKDVYIIDDHEYKFEIEKSVRINIDYAKEWRYKPWRFYIKNNPYVSKVKIPYDFVEN